MSYKELNQLGTMAQSFHFQVTPAKSKCSNAQASNCVCMTGKVGGDTPGGCFQRAPDCPEEARYCCPKGTVGRPKRYPNGYAFEYTAVTTHPKPWYPCEGRKKANSRLCNAACFDPNDIEWTNNCQLSRDARPPVF